MSQEPQTDSDSAEEPRIIVDEDWKSQVEREKEELRQVDDESPASSDSQSPEIPPASISVLLSTLATQTLSCLGVFPDPETGKPNVNRSLARHFIDTIDMLEEKTKGNLTDDEQKLMTETLHQLRMVFVSAQAQSEEPEPEIEKKSTIELP